MHDPSHAAWNALVDLIAYLYYTRELALTFQSDSQKWSLPREFTAAHRSAVIDQHGLHAWSDSSWKAQSVCGFVILLLGCPIEWSTKVIKVVCHSSAEEEVSAACMCAKAIMYCRQVCQAVGLKVKGPVHLLLDSEAAIAIATNMGVTSRTGHFMRWQHYLRWNKTNCYLELVFASGKRQLADAITKAVDITLLREFRVELYGA